MHYHSEKKNIESFLDNYGRERIASDILRIIAITEAFGD